DWAAASVHRSAAPPVPLRGRTTYNLAGGRTKRAACQRASKDPISRLPRLLVWPKTRGQPHAGPDRIGHRNKRPLARPGEEDCAIDARSGSGDAPTGAVMRQKLRPPAPEHAPAFLPAA